MVVDEDSEYRLTIGSEEVVVFAANFTLFATRVPHTAPQTRKPDNDFAFLPVIILQLPYK